jgi:AcrR family transcriptional regulator
MTSHRLTRNDWINAALDVLMTGGIDLVRVDSLAKKLKITRGSFYHHFENRQELLLAILERWRIKSTESVIEKLEKHSTTPQDQLIELILLPYKGKNSYQAASIEISLRTWARRDNIALSAIREVDSYRINFIEKLCVEMGHSASKAHDIAYLIYSYMVANTLVFTISQTTDDDAAQAKRIAKFLSNINLLPNSQY